MKIWSHTAEFKLLAFSAVTANMLIHLKRFAAHCCMRHICCMDRSLRSLRQVATLRHGHMARRAASLRSCI